MKTEYISITNAIEIFEEHKLSHWQEQLNILKKILKSDGTVHARMSKTDCERMTDFIQYIKEGKIPIYGISPACEDNEYILITGYIKGFEDTISVSLDLPYRVQYYLGNSYDYTCTYDSSYNYDTLYEYPIKKIGYHNVSIKCDQMEEFIKRIFYNK